MTRDKLRALVVEDEWAARNYLVELGISANRLSVVSYGKERPFCDEHNETCYQLNRRGHVVVRSK